MLGLAVYSPAPTCQGPPLGHLAANGTGFRISVGLASLLEAKDTTMIVVVTRSFRWNDWNRWHIERHGVSPDEAEYVVKHARRPFPRNAGGEKWAVWGQTVFGAYLQVIYTEDPDGTLYVIHARPLTAREKQQYRRYQR